MGLTDEKKGRYMDGFQALTSNPVAVSLPVSSGVAVAKGDCVVVTSGYLALATTLADLANADIYIAQGENTAAEASADGAVSQLCIPIMSNVQFQVPVTANAILDAADVGVGYNLDGSEDGITIAAGITKDFAFLVERIDISAEAVAANAYGYAIGRFVAMPETT